MHLVIVALALNALGARGEVRGDRPFGESIYDAIIVPRNGATVPTNARMFFPLPLPIDVILTTPATQIPLVLDAVPLDGVSLGALTPNSDAALVLDDGVDILPLTLHVSDAADTVAPVLHGDVVALVITSSDRPPRVVLTMPAASDEDGVAVYRAFAVDDAGARTGRFFVNAAKSGSALSVGGFIDEVGDESGATLRFVVDAVDLAGNVSAPSAPVSVTVPAAPAASGCASSSGNGAGSGVGSGGPLVGFGAALAVCRSQRRKTRRCATDRSSRAD